jgi:integrase
MPLKSLEGTAVCDAVKAAYPVGEGQYALGTRNKLLRRVGHITTFALCRAFIAKSPFHRGGVTVKQKGENRRTRRIYEEEEKRLLRAALTYEMTGTGNRVLTSDTVAEIRSRAAAGDRQIDIAKDFRISSGLCNQIVRNIIWNPERWKARETTGHELHDQIIGALDTGCRQEEMERIQNDYVDWNLHEIRMPASTNKSDIARNIPFDPKGRLAAILQKRRFIGGPKGYVFGNATGGSKPISRKVWENVVLLAHDRVVERPRQRKGALSATSNAAFGEVDLHWHDFRRECASRWLEEGVDLCEIQYLLGHASVTTTERYLHLRPGRVAESLREVWRRRAGVRRSAAKVTQISRMKPRLAKREAV